MAITNGHLAATYTLEDHFTIVIVVKYLYEFIIKII